MNLEFKRLLNEDDEKKMKEDMKEYVWQITKQFNQAQDHQNVLLGEKLEKLKEEILNEVKLMLDFVPAK